MYQSTHRRTSSSTCSRDFHGPRRRMSSVFLEDPVEGLGGGVVIGVALRPDGGDDAELVEPLGVANGPVLHAAVGVVDQAPRFAALASTLPDAVLESVEGEVGVQGTAHPPTDDAAGEQVHDEGDVDNPAQVGT